MNRAISRKACPEPFDIHHTSLRVNSAEGTQRTPNVMRVTKYRSVVCVIELPNQITSSAS